MIRLTRLNGDEFYLNAEHIQTIEATPDTHIVTANGQSYLARETSSEVADAVIAYQRHVHTAPLRVLS